MSLVSLLGIFGLSKGGLNFWTSVVLSLVRVQCIYNFNLCSDVCLSRLYFVGVTLSFVT